MLCCWSRHGSHGELQDVSSSGKLPHITTSDVFTSRCLNTPTMSIFQMPAADSNSTASPALVPHVHAHHHHGFRHHKLTALHDPHLSGLLSSESTESAEVTSMDPIAVNGTRGSADSSGSLEADAPAAKVKRDAPAEAVKEATFIPLLPTCPGRVRHF